MRRIALKKIARFHLVVSLPLAALAALALVALDPDDDDFLKIKPTAKARFEITGGLQPTLRFLGKLAKQGFLAARGQDPRKSFDNSFYALKKFAYGKLAPIPSLGVDWWRNKDFKGDPFDWSNALLSRVTPILARDFYQAYNDDGMYGVMFTAPAMLGVGASYYQDRNATAKIEKMKNSPTAKKDRGEISTEEAKAEIKQAVKNGEMTTAQGKNATRKLDMSDNQKTALNLDAADDDDFKKIETFAADLPAEEKPAVYTLLWKKYTNKRDKARDAATHSQARQLKGIIEKYFPQQRAAAIEAAQKAVR